MANQAEAMEPDQLRTARRRKILQSGMETSVSATGLQFRDAILWLQVAAYRGIYEKGGYSKEDGVKLRIAVAKSTSHSKGGGRKEECLKGVQYAEFQRRLFHWRPCKKKIMNDFRTIKINWK